MRFLLITFLTLVLQHGWSQDRQYAEEMVKKLASPELHGRGYVEKGDIKAANFIASQMKDMNLLSFTDNYLQRFPIKINRFPGKMSLKLNGKELLPGKDFIVDPSSPSYTGEFEVEIINRKRLQESRYDELLEELKAKEKRIYVIDFVGLPKDSQPLARELLGSIAEFAPLIEVKEKKLTWSMSGSQATHAAFDVLDSLVSFSKGAKVAIDIEAKLEEDFLTQNVIGYLEGKCKRRPWLIFCGHYDHLGRMGKDTYFPGANDNASGTAMILSLAKYYSENKPRRSIAFMAFGAEEVGVLGSRYYVENPLFPLDEIRFVVNMDIFGTGDEGITVVNATEYPKEFEKLKKLNNKGDYLKRVKKRGKTQNSDHLWFTELGIPAFFLYTMGGIKAYHDIYDRPETLPLTEFEDLFRLLTDFARRL